MDANLRNILLGVLFLAFGIIFFKKTYDSFQNPGQQTKEAISNTAVSAPAITSDQINGIIAGINESITSRPDMIDAIKKVIANPKINSTLWDILTTIKKPN